MQMRERLIKEIQNLSPEDIMNVYELVLDLKKQKTAPYKGSKPAYLQVQEILRKCRGSISKDIRALREDRI